MKERESERQEKKGKRGRDVRKEAPRTCATRIFAISSLSIAVEIFDIPLCVYVCLYMPDTVYQIA
jgi:hypothetical protein